LSALIGRNRSHGTNSDGNVQFYFHPTKQTVKQVNVPVKLYNSSWEKKKNRFAEASDGKITHNHAMIINGFFLLYLTKL